MRSESDQFVALAIALITVAVIAYFLYRPRVQHSKQYQATVVPLANIMDVGFIILSPAIVLLAGFSAPLVMLGSASSLWPQGSRSHTTSATSSPSRVPTTR